jgi:hypothetical protein
MSFMLTCNSPPPPVPFLPYFTSSFCPVQIVVGSSSCIAMSVVSVSIRSTGEYPPRFPQAAFGSADLHVSRRAADKYSLPKTTLELCHALNRYGGEVPCVERDPQCGHSVLKAGFRNFIWRGNDEDALSRTLYVLPRLWLRTFWPTVAPYRRV